MNPRGSASEQSVPLPLLRVAQIMPKFCACARHGNRVTPCAQRDKEFLARGVFYLCHCCTNVVANRRCATGFGDAILNSDGDK